MALGEVYRAGRIKRGEGAVGTLQVPVKHNSVRESVRDRSSWVDASRWGCALRLRVTRKRDFGRFVLLSCLAFRWLLAIPPPTTLPRAQAREGGAKKL
jgi:hypothetical protein